MPQSLPNAAGPLGGLGDMFLKVKGAKSGLIKGEAHDTAHAEEIDVLGWSWGMQGRATLGGGTATGKAIIRELKIVKRVDSSSTALMSALRSNEIITEAILTLRKAGKSPLEFLKITIEQGRLTGLTIEAGDKSGSPDLFEDLTFTFNKITVEYTPQGKDGMAKGSMMFTDQWETA
jgi:type VI secretion system secreted protein Hcp